MLVKIVIFFLVILGAIAWIGTKFRVLSGPPKRAALRPGKCRSCGAPLVGKGPCPCART